MKLQAAFALALCFAGVAQAQTTTKCSEFMGDVTCKTSAPTASVSWRDVPAKLCSRIERIAHSDSYYCEAREVAVNRKAVGDLIASGNCGEALKAALGTGDLQFAGEVRSFCASK